MNGLDLLVAMTLGDGNITINEDRFNLMHCIVQEDYLIYKKNLIENIIGKNINYYRFNNNGYPGVRFSITHPIFNIVRNIIYFNNKKIITADLLNILTPNAIAIWYMDDGSLTRKIRDGRIHGFELTISTYCSEIEIETIILYFKTRFDINFTKRFNKGSFSIRCGTFEARKFINIVQTYIVPSMFYKINMDLFCKI